MSASNSPDIPAIQRLGVQLYSVRDLLRIDFAGTLAALAEIGYAEVEFAGLFNHRAADVRDVLSGCGLRTVGSHVDFDALAMHLPQALDDAVTLGQRFVVCAWIPERHRQEAGSWQRIADLFNRVGEASHSAGIQFAYHQHAFEFTRDAALGGKVIYDFLLETTDAALVKMELDVSWAFASGVDPTDYLARCPGRFPLLHLKDWRPTVHASDIWSHAFAPGPPAKGTITNVGSGSIDWSRVLQHAETAGVQHLVIEHDAPPAPLDDLRTSFEYLRSL